MKKTLQNFLILVFVNVFCLSYQTFADNTEVPVFYTAAQQARDLTVFTEKNKYGFKDKEGNIFIPAIYQKIIMTGRYGWIVQLKSKYGLMNSKGEYLIEPKYRYADRILGRYIKLGNDKDFGIYNEYGEAIIPPEYSSIELLYGQMFLTYKNYRYGVIDFKGNVLIPNICEDIYMSSKDTMKIKYFGEWYEINDVQANEIQLPEIIVNDIDKNFKNISVNAGRLSEYSILTLSDYIVKIFSSISPAHEETIDDLMFSHGVDTVGILKNFTWIPKYPITFSKKYYEYYKNPYNGLLSDTRYKIINKGIERE